MRFDLVWGEEKNLCPIFISYKPKYFFFLESKMKLSTRKELLAEASKVLKEFKKQGSNYVYTTEEVNRIKQLIGVILNLTEDSIEELNTSSSTIKKMRASLEDSEGGNSLTNSQMSEFVKGVFGINRQGKSIGKLMKETERLLKMIGR
jgi:hypothetical protein